jgi:hypothetical protein
MNSGKAPVGIFNLHTLEKSLHHTEQSWKSRFRTLERVEMTTYKEELIKKGKAWKAAVPKEE